jgi:hypothetical protein
VLYILVKGSTWRVKIQVIFQVSTVTAKVVGPTSAETMLLGQPLLHVKDTF